MVIFNNPEDAKAVLSAGSVLTWGNFDGVHLGHQALLSRVAQKAGEKNLPAVIMTFEPRPQVFFMGETAPKPIADQEDKLALLERLGIKYAVVLPFTGEVAKLSADEFLREIPLGMLNAKSIVMGYDMAFGQGRRGDFPFLQTRMDACGYDLEQVSPTMADGRIVSSTRIREELAKGNLEELPRLMGRQHSVHGKVMRGFKRGGSILGYPTANLDPGPLLLPPGGVYACLARIGGEYSTAACNLGRNPSFGGDKTSLEAHILDFEVDIYGMDLRLYFIKRLRPEKAFSSPLALKEQIRRDVLETQTVIAQVKSAGEFKNLYPL